MKRTIITLAAIVTMVTSAFAINLSSARTEALFLSDKMAYVLNLTDDQYSAVYEINLDYILNVNSRNEIEGQYWTYRNQQLGYVLSASQLSKYKTLSYFYKPVAWKSNKITYVIHNQYTTNRYYRSAPANYCTYKGGNRTYTHSAYQGRTYSDNKTETPLQQTTQQPTLKRKEAVNTSKSNTKTQNTQSKQNTQNSSNSRNTKIQNNQNNDKNNSNNTRNTSNTKAGNTATGGRR